MKIIENGIVFSNDIELILNGNNALDYNYLDKGIIIPDKEFIKNLRIESYNLSKLIYDTNITIVSEDEMISSMNKLIDDINNKYPIVSMDQIYINCDNKNIYSLDVTRLTGSREMITRRNPLDKDGVRKQIITIANNLKKEGKDKIILLDDVIFSGSVIEYISNMFYEYGIKVVGARAAISSSEAMKKFNNMEENIICEYLMSDNVIDEICERDFFYGIAQSGMVTIENNEAYKAPYFLPFGDPVKRASCPENKKEMFSYGLVRLSLKLWEEIERLSKREIMNNELPERILNTNNNEGVIKTLKKVL